MLKTGSTANHCICSVILWAWPKYFRTQLFILAPSLATSVSSSGCVSLISSDTYIYKVIGLSTVSRDDELPNFRIIK